MKSKIELQTTYLSFLAILSFQNLPSKVFPQVILTPSGKTVVSAPYFQNYFHFLDPENQAPYQFSQIHFLLSDANVSILFDQYS